MAGPGLVTAPVRGGGTSAGGRGLVVAAAGGKAAGGGGTLLEGGVIFVGGVAGVEALVATVSPPLSAGALAAAALS